MGIENLLLGFHIAITPYNLFVSVVGVTLGTIIGVLPGLGGANGVAILLPLTFTMAPTSAIIRTPSQNGKKPLLGPSVDQPIPSRTASKTTTPLTSRSTDAVTMSATRMA